MSLSDKVLYFFYNNIFFTFQSLGGVLLPDTSILRFYSICVAASFDFLLRRYLTNLQDYRYLSDISGFLRQFPRCRLKKINIEEALPPSVITSLRNNFGKNRRSEEKWLQIFFVRAERTTNAVAKIPSADIAFLGADSGMIFVNSSSNHMSPQQKFRLLHEIGHVSYTSQSLAHRELMLGLPLVEILLWWVIQNDKIATWAGFVAIPLVALQVFFSFPTKLWYDGYNEIIADHFALTHLPHSDRVHLANYMLKNFERRFPFNLSLLIFNETRASDLRAKLQLIHDERDTNQSFKEIHNGYSLLWWIGPLLAILLALLSVPIAQRELSALLAITIFLMVVTLIYEVRKKRKFVKVMEELRGKTEEF